MHSHARLARVIRWATGGLVIGVIAGVSAYFVLGWLAPRYRSVVVYEALPPHDTTALGASMGPAGLEEMDRYLRTQASVMVSDRILERALNEPAVAACAWAERFTSDDTFVPEDALGHLRAIVDARLVRDTNLIRLSVTVDDPESAATLATAVDEVYRTDSRVTSTRTAQALIEALERKIRDRRQDVAALDIRIRNIIDEHRLTAMSVEHTAPYQERSALLVRLAEAGARAASAPDSDEHADTRAPTAVIERLERRVEALDARLNERVRVLKGMEHLEAERTAKMQQIQSLQEIVDDLAFQIDRGSRVRVLTPAETPDEPEPPPFWPALGLGAALFALLGSAIAGVRP